ncbi:septum formation family protein [Nocardioides sp. CER19]|uniref:septum formation family protein n=1 Tax=Nocardioides sp. CER19 TaxID=3038538 RepID=UPI00244C142F|nr:septum formation family protein [Nocardioides sp. CER19]MDH2413785.1 septum formation family protein [Nocardioides sp. CER19]
MNGPDLRFLAERASALDDRTFERLDEVHARIAASRERRRIGVAVGAAGLVAVLAAGVAILDRGGRENSPAPAPKPTETATVGAGAGGAPARGTCWAVPPKAAVEPTDYFDDSPEVPCSQPHTTETVATFTLAEATEEEADARGGTCYDVVGEYLNIDNESWIHWAAAWYLPSKEQVAAGESWARCDAVIPGPWWSPTGEHAAPARTLTRSALDLADEPPDDLWTCLAEPPTSEQPTIPCDRPHAYEATGTLAALGGISTYPSADVLRAEAQEDCTPAVPKRLAGASVIAGWDPEEGWHSPVLHGVCFVYRANGELLPPR